MTRITARISPVSDTEFELYWNGTFVASTTKDIEMVDGEERVRVLGDFAADLVDFAEANAHITELRYMMAGAVDWKYTDDR